MEARIVLFLLFGVISASLAAAQRDSSLIPVSSELRAGTNSSVWLSPSRVFAFGFYNTPNGYAVCVFLAGVSERTVVWTAKELDPIFPNDVDYMQIMEDRIRLFQKRDGGYSVYYDIPAPEVAISGASMLDNGNFVIYNLNGGVIWQSFDFPTDTLLPGQRLPTGQELFSRASKTDLEIGKFRLKMQTDGNLVQYPITTSDTSENAYYASGSYGKGMNLSLNLESGGHLYLYNGSSSVHNITSGGGNVNSIYLARVDPDGIFRLYNRSLDLEEGEWTVIWSSTKDKCDPKGICGVNSFCAYEDEKVTCTCLPGFGGDCAPKLDTGDCLNKNPSVRYELKTVRNVTWLDNYYAMNDTVGEEDCGRACLDDCDCVVALFENGKCRKQRFPMKYGRRSAFHSNTILVRVSLPAKPAPAGPLEAPNASGFGKELPEHKKGTFYQHKNVIIGVPTGIAALVILSIIIYYLTTKGNGFFPQDEESKQNVDKLVISHGSLAPKRYSYREIRKITKSFTDKLGQGGYGIVYKGMLRDSQLVAVKVLKETDDDAEEFINEVASISKTSHVNIVNLLGFCFERKKRALIYEFMPNKSLDMFIYKCGSANPECSLEWSKLHEIAVGVARGLEYLHKGCNTRIVHFDIKPQNILLDEDFSPKISDFGLAKLCKKKQSVISMLGARGTIGYIAPEVFSRNFGVVSHKSDVYSYGIMLLQMAKARAYFEIKPFQSSEDDFLEKVYKHVLVQNEKVYDKIREDEEEIARKMLMVGFWCIQTAPSDRPSMNYAMEMLVGNSQSIQIAPFAVSAVHPDTRILMFAATGDYRNSKFGWRLAAMIFLYLAQMCSGIIAM